MIDKGTAYLFIDDAHIESLEGATKGVVSGAGSVRSATD